MPDVVAQPNIAVVDYHKGNLSAVERGLITAGASARITDEPAVIEAADALVIPGVGSFEDAMAFMHESGQADAVSSAASAGKPILGICLGLQLLFERGNESDDGSWVAGLGFLPGEVTLLPHERLKVPHMGWNSLDITPQGRACPLLAGVNEGANFYFTHSYAAVLDYADPIVAARTHYALSFASVVWHNNIFACQFHPEKSSEHGAIIMRNFVRIAQES